MEIVRLLAKLGSETSTRGYRPVKMVAMRPIAPSPVAANAQPSRSVRVSISARRSTIAVSAAGMVVGRIARSLLSCATSTVHAAAPIPRTMAGTTSRWAVRDARSRKSPVVRRVRYVAPCRANIVTTASPAATV